MPKILIKELRAIQEKIKNQRGQCLIKPCIMSVMSIALKIVELKTHTICSAQTLGEELEWTSMAIIIQEAVMVCLLKDRGTIKDMALLEIKPLKIIQSTCLFLITMLDTRRTLRVALVDRLLLLRGNEVFRQG